MADQRVNRLEQQLAHIGTMVERMIKKTEKTNAKLDGVVLCETSNTFPQPNLNATFHPKPETVFPPPQPMIHKPTFAAQRDSSSLPSRIHHTSVATISAAPPTLPYNSRATTSYSLSSMYFNE